MKRKVMQQTQKVASTVTLNHKQTMLDVSVYCDNWSVYFICVCLDFSMFSSSGHLSDEPLNLSPKCHLLEENSWMKTGQCDYEAVILAIVW